MRRGEKGREGERRACPTESASSGSMSRTYLKERPCRARERMHAHMHTQHAHGHMGMGMGMHAPHPEPSLRNVRGAFVCAADHHSKPRMEIQPRYR